MRHELEKWIAALNSGDYNQQKGSLSASGTTHCCLGVLAEVADAPRHRNYAEMMLVEHYPYIHNNEEVTIETEGISDTMLDNDWFFDTVGLSPSDQEHLAYCNDYGATFAEIANALSNPNPSLAIEDLVTFLKGTSSMFPTPGVPQETTWDPPKDWLNDQSTTKGETL